MVIRVPTNESWSEEQAKRLLLLQLEDDTEDAPWMVMGSLQFEATWRFYESLQYFAETRQQPWFVAGMLPILFIVPGESGKKQLAPDVFVAFGPNHPRLSFEVDDEGGFPPFVLEVVSPSSQERDHGVKHDAYEALGVREYVLFTPLADRPSTLSGYRRNASGQFETWWPDEAGRLWSDVLGLYLVVQGMGVRAADREGVLIPTLLEAVAAQRAAEEREAVVRHEATEELERLRRENEQLRRQSQT